MRRLVMATAFATLVSIAPVSADGYPSKQIIFIVPIAAGGPLDLIARSIVEPMSVDLGQPIVIENVPGAGGSARSVTSFFPSIPTDHLSRCFARYMQTRIWAGDTTVSRQGFMRLAESLRSGGFISSLPDYDTCVANLPL
jgi:hypothetical protein